MKHRRRTNWIVYLIFGIVITSFVTTVTLSRYMSNISGNGVVTVANLDTNVSTFTFTPTNLNKPGTTEIVRFNIVNFTGLDVSEVEQNYSITINSTENLPFTYELECVDTGSNGVGINTTKAQVNTNVQLNGGLLNHSVFTTHQYELTVSWPSNLKDISLTEEIELITVVINSEQVLNP